MSNDSKKLLTLGNVEAIKDYIDTTSGNIKYYIDEEFKEAVNTKIQEATTAINDNFIAKTTEITNKITLLEQTSGNKDEINELKLQLDAVKADNDAMNTALEALSAELDAGLNDVSGSILSAGQINDLISTALINSVNISDDAIEAPTVYTQNLVALIGKFGQIKATNIVGSEISGKTVKSVDGNWELNNNGSGVLANGNIIWNENGDVTFGPNVKLNWSNIEGGDDATDGVEAAMNAATAAAAAAATAQATANEATALANDAKNSIPTEDRITEITRNSITTETITGTTLSGKTIKSTDNKWELSRDGSGKLANGNITWTKDGVVTFSDNVELKWDNITDAPTIPDGNGGLSEAEVESKIATAISQYEVKAENITGTTLSGKTIKSVDDGEHWMIDKDGSGHLADGNISWDNSGNLNVNGNIVGNIGVGTNDSKEDVVIGGNLIIKNNDVVITELTPNYLYDISEVETADADTYKDRYITIASGIPDVSKLSIWQPTTESAIDAPYTYIYTLNSYDSSNLVKNNTPIQDVYYLASEKQGSPARGTQRHYYLPVYEPCKINSYKFESQEDGSYTSTADLYISINYEGVLYKYVPMSGNQSVSVGNDRKLDFANTKILDDGTIYTKSIIAENGNFYGSIDADGRFSGSLDTTGGYVKDCNISSSNITINGENYLRVYKSTSSDTVADSVKDEILSITPNAVLHDNTTYKTKYYLGKLNAYKQHTKNGNTVWTNQLLLATINVEPGDVITIPVIDVNARVYQPHKKYGKNSKPSARVFIKYADGSTQPIAGAADMADNMRELTIDEKSKTYNGRQYNWKTNFDSVFGYIINVPEDTKAGAAKIYLNTSVWMNDRQGVDKASCSFTCNIKDSIEVAHNGASGLMTAISDNSIIVPHNISIGVNGIVVKTSSGCKIQTINNGNIELLSANGSYGLLISDAGVKIKRGSEWTTL